MNLLRLRSAPAWAARRLRPRLLPILQTAAAAVAAYYLALLLPIDDNRPVFASIAAVISLGASYHQRGRRAVELVAGVVLGLTVADLILHAIGTGPLQIGLMIILAMSAAVVLGGGELLVSEAAVSALLLASIEPTNSGYSPDRFLEAMIGGVVAIAVGSLFFPPDPSSSWGARRSRSSATSARRSKGWRQRWRRPTPSGPRPPWPRARAIDVDMRHLEEAARHRARDGALRAPAKGRPGLLERYARTLPHLDFAVRNARVLARHALRYTRTRLVAPDRPVVARARARPGRVEPGRRPRRPARGGPGARPRAQRAAHAREAFEQEPDLALTEIISQVRSAAVDVMRAAEAIAGVLHSADELPTEEMLASPRPAPE